MRAYIVSTAVFLCLLHAAGSAAQEAATAIVPIPGPIATTLANVPRL
jgi:hypothetical protein